MHEHTNPRYTIRTCDKCTVRVDHNCAVLYCSSRGESDQNRGLIELKGLQGAYLHERVAVNIIMHRESPASPPRVCMCGEGCSVM